MKIDKARFSVKKKDDVVREMITEIFYFISRINFLCQKVLTSVTMGVVIIGYLNYYAI